MTTAGTETPQHKASSVRSVLDTSVTVTGAMVAVVLFGLASTVDRIIGTMTGRERGLDLGDL